MFIKLITSTVLIKLLDPDPNSDPNPNQEQKFWIRIRFRLKKLGSSRIRIRNTACRGHPGKRARKIWRDGPFTKNTDEDGKYVASSFS